jgi:hypothetical protein
VSGSNRFTVCAVYDGDVQAVLRAAPGAANPVAGAHPPVIVVLDGADLLPKVHNVQRGRPYTVALTEGWLGKGYAEAGQQDMLNAMFAQLDAEARPLGLRLVDVGMLPYVLEDIVGEVQKVIVRVTAGAGKRLSGNRKDL